jgi:hypothetical protein
MEIAFTLAVKIIRVRKTFGGGEEYVVNTMSVGSEMLMQ